MTVSKAVFLLIGGILLLVFSLRMCFLANQCYKDSIAEINEVYTVSKRKEPTMMLKISNYLFTALMIALIIVELLIIYHAVKALVC